MVRGVCEDTIEQTKRMKVLSKVKLEIVSNNRRDPKVLKKYFEDLKNVYPWKSERELISMAKSLYSRKHRS